MLGRQLGNPRSSIQSHRTLIISATAARSAARAGRITSMTTYQDDHILARAKRQTQPGC